MSPGRSSSRRIHSTYDLQTLLNMAGQSWAQHAIDRFFEGRESPTQSQCDDHAHTLSGASVVKAVQAPGSLSYTVICIRCRDREPDMIVSFRDPGSMLDQGGGPIGEICTWRLGARSYLSRRHEGAQPPLHVYTMPYLPGISCLEALSAKANLGT